MEGSHLCSVTPGHQFLLCNGMVPEGKGAPGDVPYRQYLERQWGEIFCNRKMTGALRSEVYFE